MHGVTLFEKLNRLISTQWLPDLVAEEQSFVEPICFRHLVSSAYVSHNLAGLVESRRSLIYIRNSKGPRILPYGTPESTGSASDNVPVMETHHKTIPRDF